MIKPITSKTKLSIIETIVEIHKRCVLESNSPWYKPDVISEWISQISVKNVLDQLTRSSKWIILEEKGKIIGFAQYSLVEKELFQIQILPNKQRKGFGTTLYKYIEKDFIKNKVKTISLFSTLNPINFYKSLGFEKIRKISYPLVKTKVELIEMKKELNIVY